MGQRGPTAAPVALQLVRNDPRQRGKAALASMLDDQVRPKVEIPAWPEDLVPVLPVLELPESLRRERTVAGNAIADEARAEWDRITPHLQQLGLISQLDRAGVVMYCFWWAIGAVARRRIVELGDAALVDVTPSGYKQMGVWLQVASKADGEAKTMLAQFGLTPASRSRVTPSDPQGRLPGIESPPQEGGWGTFPEAPKSSA